MYVWARLARVYATAHSRGPLTLGDETSMILRCLPSDVDTNLHMNNARYATLADLGRIDFFIRSGLMAARREHGWSPLMGGIEMAFLREIRLWTRFRLVTRIETWSGLQLIGTHRYVLENGETAALVMTTAGIYNERARKFLPVGEVLAELGYKAEPRPLTETEAAFVASHANLRRMARGIPKS